MRDAGNGHRCSLCTQQEHQMSSCKEEIECAEEKSTRFASTYLTFASSELEQVAYEWADAEEEERTTAEYLWPGLALVLSTRPVKSQHVARSTSLEVHP